MYFLKPQIFPSFEPVSKTVSDSCMNQALANDSFSIVFIFAAAGAQMTLSPMNLIVVRGEEARFTCSTTNRIWSVMLWLMNGRPVLSISRDYGVLRPIYQNVTAINKSNSREDTWVFIVNSTERYNQGQVTCELQSLESRTANLLVQGVYCYYYYYYYHCCLLWKPT